MTKTMIRLLAAATLCALPATADAAVVHDFRNGKLMGASGVMVKGDTYTISFLDGTCESVYGKCELSAFDFRTLDDASLAAQALLDQVFTVGMVNGLTYDFDENTRANGCSENFTCSSNIIWKVEGTEIGVVLAENNSKANARADRNFSAKGRTSYNSNDYGGSNFARFTLTSTAAAVPEPSTWALMLAGFGLTGAALRRRRSAATGILA